jgi:hypothetical protein
MAKWPRIDIYVPDPEVRRRIKVAAARQDIRVSQWCLEAILERLAQEEVFEEQTYPIEEPQVDLIFQLHSIQERIKAHRGGKILMTLDEHLERDRLERNHELFGLR